MRDEKQWAELTAGGADPKKKAEPPKPFLTLPKVAPPPPPLASQIVAPTVIPDAIPEVAPPAPIVPPPPAPAPVAAAPAIADAAGSKNGMSASSTSPLCGFSSDSAMYTRSARRVTLLMLASFDSARLRTTGESVSELISPVDSW